MAPSGNFEGHTALNEALKVDVALISCPASNLRMRIQCAQSCGSIAAPLLQSAGTAIIHGGEQPLLFG